MNAWPVRMSIAGAFVPAVKFWRGSGEVASVGAALALVALISGELCEDASPPTMPTEGGGAGGRAGRLRAFPELNPSVAAPRPSAVVEESRPHAESAQAVIRNKVVAFIGGLVEVLL